MANRDAPDRYWPPAPEQEVIAQFCAEDPLQAYTMCFLLGAYRQQGYPLATAVELVRQMVATPTSEESADDQS